MNDYVALVSFLFDSAFAYFYLNTAAHLSSTTALRRILSTVVCLALTLLLYPLKILPFISGFGPRLIVRVLIYMFYLVGGLGISPSLSLYYAAFSTTVYFIPQNAFLTPITMPFLNEKISLFSAAWVNIFFVLPLSAA